MAGTFECSIHNYNHILLYLRFRGMKIFFNAVLFRITLVNGYVPQKHCIYWDGNFKKNNLYVRSPLIMSLTRIGRSVLDSLPVWPEPRVKAT